MKYAVLGTGTVGHTLASKLVQLGHQVGMGAREPGNEKALAWAEGHGARARSGSFADMSTGADRVIVATAGGAIVEVAAAMGDESVAGKLVIDVSNPLDFSRGMPPSLVPGLSNTTSAAEVLQAKLPSARVVKTLNTMNHLLMVDPSRVPGPHDVFLCGDDEHAKTETREMLAEFGWTDPVDLGGLSAARGLEGLMPFWLSMWGAVGSPDFNYHIARAR